MQGRTRRALRQPALAWLFMLAGVLAMSWPLLDVVAGSCPIAPAATAIAFECQLQTQLYLFAVWAALIVALLAIAVAGAPERPVKPGERDADA